MISPRLARAGKGYDKRKVSSHEQLCSCPAYGALVIFAPIIVPALSRRLVELTHGRIKGRTAHS